jgi:hypothetical protein
MEFMRALGLEFGIEEITAIDHVIHSCPFVPFVATLFGAARGSQAASSLFFATNATNGTEVKREIDRWSVNSVFDWCNPWPSLHPGALFLCVLAPLREIFLPALRARRIWVFLARASRQFSADETKVWVLWKVRRRRGRDGVVLETVRAGVGVPGVRPHG